MMSEREFLEALDRAVRSPRAAPFLAALVPEISAVLKKDPAARLAWRSVPLNLYDSLPDGIASSWVFILRAGCSSGAERHPNSIQRVMSYRGSADMRTWHGHSWTSNLLTSDPSEPLERRWLSIPMMTWHRPVMGEADWAVVSFHTVPDSELIEELAMDDEDPDQGCRAGKVYAGREAR
jgi:hypothetical protein